MLSANRPDAQVGPDVFQGLVVRGDGQDLPAAIDAATGGATETLTIPEAIDAIPGVTEQQSTFNQIIGVTVVIALVVIGLFFALLTVERTSLYGVLKALGARSSTIFGGLVAQAVVVTFIATFIAGSLVVILDLLIPPGSIPLLITPCASSPASCCSSSRPSSAARSPCDGSCASTRPLRSAPRHDPRCEPTRHHRSTEWSTAMTTTAVTTALEMSAVRKVYTMGDGSEVVALDHATLTLGSDEMVALVGPSGSGKTTLCSIAGGILSATEGHIVVGGEDISGHTAKELTKFRQSKVGFVFQSVNLVPFLNARENLLVVDELGKRTGAPARARADQLLEELGLADRAKNLPSQLSGGQRQRVAIGRALMNDPALVLFDEPTSALDTKLGEQVMELIRNEMKSRGTAAIVVTHDERITHYCDRSVHIIDGRLDA